MLKEIEHMLRITGVSYNELTTAEYKYSNYIDNTQVSILTYSSDISKNICICFVIYDFTKKNYTIDCNIEVLDNARVAIEYGNVELSYQGLTLPDFVRRVTYENELLIEDMYVCQDSNTLLGIWVDVLNNEISTIVEENVLVEDITPTWQRVRKVLTVDQLKKLL